MTKLFNLNQFYDWLAPVYATAMGFLPMWRRYTEAVLPYLPENGEILEVGPGPGLLLSKLGARHAMAAGLDLSAGMLRQASARLQRAGLPVHLGRGDMTVLPFKSQSFDAVATTFALSAVPDGLAAVQEMARVLRIGGTLALVDAGYPADGNWIGSGLARLWELGGDFMRDEAALMEATGLEIIEQKDLGAWDSVRLVVGRKSSQE
jgi:ubiquinone/menaquinone biosynthesis C-methylase UbiE